MYSMITDQTRWKPRDRECKTCRKVFLAVSPSQQRCGSPKQKNTCSWEYATLKKKQFAHINRSKYNEYSRKSYRKCKQKITLLNWCAQCRCLFKRGNNAQRLCGSILKKKGCSYDEYLRSRKAWREKNREKVLFYQRASEHNRRRARRGRRIFYEEWKKLLMETGGKCLCCRIVKSESLLTMDHIVPLVKGGNHDIANIQPLCRSCNSKKGKRTIVYPKDECFTVFQPA